MKTIKFKPEYENKLKSLKIKTKFIKNIKSCNDLKVIKPHDFYEALSNEFNWYSFICSAFTFCESKEGFDFWYKISLKK